MEGDRGKRESGKTEGEEGPERKEGKKAGAGSGEEACKGNMEEGGRV